MVECFYGRLSTILDEIKTYCTNTFEAINEIEDVKEEDLQELLDRKYHKTEISIDYGILEKSKNIYVVPSDIGWDDIGSLGIC